jgi:cytidylate kinase
MSKQHIITIAGRPGSGKSSTGKAVAAALGYQHFSSGDLFRSLGKDRGIDVLQANLSAEDNDELDVLVDGRLREMGANQDHLVVDSRTAWHWMPNSFKVFLDLDLKTAAERILESIDGDRLTSEQIHHQPEKYEVLLKHRLDSENRRYKMLYGIEPHDKTNYDLVVNTATSSLDEVIKLVLEEYKKWLKNK